MGIVVETSQFKGQLLPLIGQSKDVVAKYDPVYVVEGGCAERAVWDEQAKDEATGEFIRLTFSVRLLDKTVWAVGVRSDKYLCVVDTTTAPIPFMKLIPKPAQISALAVNWICKKNGRFVNLGIGV